jgi:shikimate kinase
MYGKETSLFPRRDSEGQITNWRLEMKHYFLFGLPQCGDITLGRRAAELLQMPYCDINQSALEKMDFSSTANFMSFSTMDRLISFQKEVIFSLSEIDTSTIFSAGSEVVNFPSCVAEMKRIGTIIYIQRDTELILTEVRASVHSRQVMLDVYDGSYIDPLEMAVLGFSEVLPKYKKQADYIVENNGTEEEGVQKLVSLLKELTKPDKTESSSKSNILPFISEERIYQSDSQKMYERLSQSRLPQKPYVTVPQL